MTIQNGIFDGISSANYHASDGISKSDLDSIHRSVSHWRWSKEHRVQTKAMVLGSAFHDSILLPETFENEYVIEPTDINKRTNKGKEEYTDWLSRNVGKQVLTIEEYEDVVNMRNAIEKNKVVQRILKNAKYEQSAWCDCKLSGLRKKCRPDILRMDGIIADLKTTDDASYDAFARSINKYRYHVQAAYYCDIITDLTGIKYESFILIAIEKTPPFAIAIYDIGELSINKGRELYNQDLLKYKRSIEINELSYPEFIQNIEIPKWSFNN